MTKPELTSFVSVFGSLFQNVGSISEETEFRQLEEWSSMQALILIAAIDEHYGVTIPELDFRSATTVSDLFKLIIKFANDDS